MIARLFRFHGHNALLPVYRRAQTARGPLMSLKYAPQKSNGAYRAAVVVSRKVSKSAVTRNLIRRRVFEIIRTTPVKPSLDLIVTIFSAEAAGLPQPELRSQLRNLLKKANALEASQPPHAIVGSKRED